MPIPRHEILKLHQEVDCRVEHGAESNGHLDYVRAELKRILDAYADPPIAPPIDPKSPRFVQTPGRDEHECLLEIDQ